MVAIIFSKQTGELSVPLTVRIEWFPDGKIRPLKYWTPDNSCYEAKHVFESTLLAFLKDRGEGIRFRVRSEIIESEYDDMLRTQHETYLYFTDNRFCAKGFIDERYEHESKKYVPVVLDVFPDGDYELISFWVEDNRYVVEKIISIEPRGSFYAGGIGIWHKVEARLVNETNDEDPDPFNSIRRTAALFWELNKWFVVKSA